MNPRPEDGGRDPFEDRIRSALSTQARRADDPDDLGAPAIAQASRIRRRRSTLTALAAVVVVLAVAVPLGIRSLPTSSVQPSDHTSAPVGPTGPATATSTSTTSAGTKVRTVPVDVTALSQGDQLPTAYLQGRTLMGGVASASTPASEQGGITIAGTDQILWAGFTSTGAAAITYDTQSMQGTLTFYDHDNQVTSAVPHVERAKLSPDGTTILWFTNDRDLHGLNTRGSSVVVKNLASGVSHSLDEPNAFGGYPLQVSADRVQFALWTDAEGNHGQLQNWSWNGGGTPSKNAFVPRAMSSDGWTSTLGNGCDFLLEPTGQANGKTAWQTCQLALDWIGPGGAYVVGPAQNAKRAPFSTVSAVTPTDRTWPSPNPAVSIVTWTHIGVTDVLPMDDHTVEMVASSNGRQAIVRCDTGTGQCERVTSLAAAGTYRLFG